VLADLTTIALPLAIMDRDIALSNLAGCRNTSSSGKIALTVPSALLWLFAYTQHAWYRQHFQAFPPISPVSGALPISLIGTTKTDK
jgi:hypothetical protein